MTLVSRIPSGSDARKEATITLAAPNDYSLSS